MKSPLARQSAQAGNVMYSLHHLQGSGMGKTGKMGQTRESLNTKAKASKETFVSIQPNSTNF
jgi:hypothetical protein